jgi:hypothetical protein
MWQKPEVMQGKDFKIWFGGENESFNAEFIWHNVSVKRVSVLIRSATIIFTGVHF